jgi:plasmid maintenance system killer protein
VVTATVYRDQKMLYGVVPTISSQGAKIGESAKGIALDMGTYYIAIKTDPYSLVSSADATTTTFVRGKSEFIIYYQRVDSDELFRPSSVNKENPLTFETVFKSLLTVPNPKDYYQFELTDKALIKINFMYASTKNAKFTLYGPDREELLTKTFTGNNVWYNIEKYLEPGVYYCSLETLTANDGGQASILINQTVYPLILSQENQTTNSYITVSTIDQPIEIRWVKGKLTNSELNSSKWKSGKVITDTKVFGINMTGYYTVRVTDEYGNMFMQSIRVTNCDKKAPAKPVIKTYTAGTLDVSGTAEKNSLVTVYVNGKAFTCTASSKGNFKLTLKAKLMKEDIIEVSAQDISGNISERAEVIVK